MVINCTIFDAPTKKLIGALRRVCFIADWMVEFSPRLNFGMKEAKASRQQRLNVQRGFASKVRLFKISFTPGLSPVIGSWKKFAKPFLTVSSSSRTTKLGARGIYATAKIDKPLKRFLDQSPGLSHRAKARCE